MSIQTQNIQFLVTADESIDKAQLSIDFSELGWHTIVYPVYVNGRLLLENYPNNEGVYTLTINFNNSLTYQEIAFYRQAPKFEKIRFHFYTESDKMFCSINSIALYELNKTILMNPIDGALSEILDIQE